MSQTNLSPSPGALGLHSPALGPWFTDANITLGLPDTRLAVTLASDGTWQPPAAGVLSLFVATATRPAPLARLRDPEGNPAFETGRLVGVFELLPQVTTRLGGLMRKLPSLAGAQPPTGPTRPIPHTFALEFTPPTLDAAFALARVDGLLTFPTGISDESARLAYLGLTKTGATLANSPAPMRDLFRPGQSMLKFPNGTRLWSFDPRGHALDPGAVACWLAWLAGENGFAGLYGSGDRTAAIKPGSERLTIELVNPHEGPLDADTLPRLTLSNATGTGRLRHRTAEQTPISVTFTAPPAAPAPDPLPLARAAVLPDGSYAETLTLSSANAPLTRDHVRVAITSIERHLIGQPRHTTAAAGTPDKRRADDQARESTRVRVERATNATLLPHPGAIAGAILTALQSADPVDLATWAIGLDYGPPATPGALPDISPPATLTLTAAALVGGGTAAAGTVAGQRALLTIELPEDAAGAWVRAWTQGFAPETGERDRLDGGAGVAIAEADKAIARLVVPLPDGAVTPQAPLGADVIVVTRQGSRLYTDQRFERPAPVGGAPATPGSGPFVLCEQGLRADTLANVAAGTHVVALTTPHPTLVAPAPAHRAPATLRHAAGSGDRVRVTPSPFDHQPRGDQDDPINGAIHRTARTTPDAWQAGAPRVGMQRLELVAAAHGAAPVAIIGGGPALADRNGRPPHHLGHPGDPAGPDVTAVGLQLEGPAAHAIGEYARERTSTHTPDLAARALTAPAAPAAPAAPRLWAAGLRTVAAGVEAEVGADLILGALGGAYPFGDELDKLRTWFQGNGIPVPAGVDTPLRAAARALDRRLLASAHGAREAATALVAALGRAEDLVYIETPALDDHPVGPDDDRLHLLSALRARLSARPGLRVVLCLPVFLDVGHPRALQRIRDQAIIAALQSLAPYEPRLAIFSPAAGPGRTLKLATTTVIIDDAWFMTGTTHLWRRGLSFDASYAVTLFDDKLVGGRPEFIVNARRALLAARLGVTLAELPEDPVDLVTAIRLLIGRGGFSRLADDRIRPPVGEPDGSEATGWNPDGSASDDFNAATAIFQAAGDALTETLRTP